VDLSELLAESRRRAALWESLRDPSSPPHIGILEDNTAEYLFWLGAAALTRSVLVGINSTYRGAELGRLVDHTDCQLIVTNERLHALIDQAPHGVAADRTLDVNSADYLERLAAAGAGHDIGGELAQEDDLFLLIFTSGSTNFPKAVRCTQGRFARTGTHVAGSRTRRR